MGAINMFNDFVKLIESESLPVEAVAIADGDAIIAERHFVPDQDRNIYSHTKSYVSTAIGIAIEDGLLSLDSRLVDSFPEYVPSDAQLELGQITLRHLLTMSSGFNHAYLMNPDRRSGVGAPDYLRYMFSRRVEVEPGSTFCYSSADSDLAGRMLEQAAGMRLGEYLYGTIFSKLDQGWPVWECDPQGHPIAGGGIYMSLANMLKLGQVYLNGMARALSANRGSSRLPVSRSTLRIAIFGRAVMAISSGCRLMRGHIVRMVRTVRLLRFCRSRVWLLRFNARNLVISTISFVLLCMSICYFRLLPERTTFAHTVV